MPRSQGTSRKGKPKKDDRSAGMGKALQKSHRSGNTGKTFTTKNKGAGMNVKSGIAGPPTAHLSSTLELAEKNMSLMELDHLDDFLVQAEMVNKEFASEKAQFVVLDSHGTTYDPGERRVHWEDTAETKFDFNFQALSVPRRPAWDETTTPEELERMENESFVQWRRAIAAKEEEVFSSNSGSQQHAYMSQTVTPYEKNLQVWRQLWRVLERCSCIMQLVDARNPMFYLSDDLREYAKELNKPIMLVVNKGDYLSPEQRRVWSEYLTERNWDHVFFSAHLEQAKLDQAAHAEAERLDRLESSRSVSYGSDDGSDDAEEEDSDDYGAEEEKDSPKDVDNAPKDISPPDKKNYPAEKENIKREDDKHGVRRLLTRQELTDWMHDFALNHGCKTDPRYENRIQFGTVGFPNVGKSSVINVLMGSSKHTHGLTRVGVAAQPGKTKHFQTLFLPERDDLMLCDCPGLVFPSFVSNTADLIAAGVYPISQMRDHWPVIELICRRIPREIIDASYGIHIPEPSAQSTDKVPSPTAEEFMTTYCVARSMLAAASGVPDYTRAARIIIKDYVSGKLLYCHPPPAINDAASFHMETVKTAIQNSEKLQRKLESTRQQQLNATNEADNAEGEAKVKEDEFDTDLLGMIGESNAIADSEDGGKRGKAHKTRKRHGKKGRKLREKDPYGCHKGPDEMLAGGEQPVGVSVNAGKYGRKNYTRALNYSGARSAIDASATN